MQEFKLGEDGDVVMKNNKIVMVEDNELLRQKCQYVLNTNKGECFYNLSEGIVFQNILGKNVEDEAIKREILDGILQVDDSFFLYDFSTSYNNKTRKKTAKFKANNSKNEIISTEVSYG